MSGTSGRTLSRGLRIILACIGMWLALAALPVTDFNAYAQQATDTSKICTPEPNMCGCLTCGCPDTGRPQCPPGSSIYDDYCLPDCPGGYIRYPGYPGLCMPPCTHGCPDGWEQIPLPICPEGYHRDLNNPDYCALDDDRVRNNDYCPGGMSYSSETGKCELDCPDGYARGQNGLCEWVYERECRDGYVRDRETGKCLPPGVWPPGYRWICLPYCPPGTVRDFYHPTRCVPPPPQCPDGFETYNGRCVPVCEQGVTRDPYGYCVPRCPDGSYPNLRGQCQEPDCPQGSETFRGQCVPECPPEYSRDENGRCLPPDDDCPQGTTNIRGQCVPDCEEGWTRSSATGQCEPPNNRCPEGQITYKGKCVQRCPADQVRDNNGRCVCQQGTDNFQGKCVPLCRPGLVRNSAGRCVCPQGTDFFGGKCVPECEGNLVRDKNGRCLPPPCPQGLERFQGRCVQQCKDSFVRNSKGRCVCPRGEEVGNSGFCEPISIRPRECPKGFRRNEDGDCVRIRQVPSGCRDGFYFDKRRQRCLPIPDDDDEPVNPQLQINPDQLRRLLVPPQRDQKQPCPDGFFPDKNGRCVEG